MVGYPSEIPRLLVIAIYTVQQPYAKLGSLSPKSGRLYHCSHTIPTLPLRWQQVRWNLPAGSKLRRASSVWNSTTKTRTKRCDWTRVTLVAMPAKFGSYVTRPHGNSLYTKTVIEVQFDHWASSNVLWCRHAFYFRFEIALYLPEEHHLVWAACKCPNGIVSDFKPTFVQLWTHTITP